MRNFKIKQYWPFFLSAFAWLAIDLISKYAAFKGKLDSVVLIKNFLYLSSQTNQGIAFGIYLGYMIQLITSIIILSFLIYFGFTYLFLQKRNLFLNQALLGIIVGGAIGNLANRLQLGYVIDFIILRPFPVFNFADIGITVGLIILFLLTLKTANNKH